MSAIFQWALVVVAVIWAGFPIIAAVVAQFVFPTWILQETSRQWIWMAAVGLVWGLSFALTMADRHHFGWREWGGLVICSALSGWWGGLLFMNLFNSVGASSEMHEVDVKILQWKSRQIVIGVSDGPCAGTTFAIANTAWKGNERASRKMILHRGRLGLYWGEFKP